MLVRDRMSRKVVAIDAERPLTEARTLLKRHRFRQLPVVRKGRLVGIITQRDLRDVKPTVKTVAARMTAKPFTIGPDTAVDEAARLLRTYKIGALPVVEGGHLAGILTVSDVLDAFVELSGVSEPTYRITAVGRGRRPMSARARHAVEHGHGEVKWIHCDARKRPPTLYMRVKVKDVEDIVTALEAEGFEVAGVVASARRT